MKIIRPTAITSDMLISTNVPEYKPAAWSSGGTYSIGNQVSVGDVIYEAILASGPGDPKDPTIETTYWIYIQDNSVDLWNVGTSYSLGDLVTEAGTHRIYESIVIGTNTNTGNTPSADDQADPQNWLDVGATYPWRAFDGVVGSTEKVTRTGEITYAIKPGLYKGIGLLNLEGTECNIILNDPVSGEVYNETKLLTALADADSDIIVTDWYSYFFSEVRFITDIVFTDIPPFTNATTYITISQSEGVKTELGEIVLGRVVDLGVTQYAPEFTIVDYSRKEKDIYGNFIVTERAYSKRVDVRTIVPNYSINNVTNTLAEIRATPVLWITTEISIYDTTLLVYGYFKDFRVIIPHSRWAEMNLQIEGLT